MKFRFKFANASELKFVEWKLIFIIFGLFSFASFFFAQPVQMMSFASKMTRPFQSYSYELFQAGTFKD